MPDNTSGEYQRLVSQFWHNYLSLLEKFFIPVKARPWKPKRVEEYISTHQGVKLQHHSPHHIDEYLLAKGRMAHIPEWRFRQTADALRLLFKELIRPEWAACYDWYQWRAFSRELEPVHPTLMRDGNPSTLVAPNNNPLIRNTCKTQSAGLQIDQPPNRPGSGKRQVLKSFTLSIVFST